VQSAIGENLQKIERLYVPQKTKKTEHIEGSAGEIAKKLVDKLGMNCGCFSPVVKRRSAVGVVQAESRFLGGLCPLGMTRRLRESVFLCQIRF
jgi:hypothetical protein